MAYILESSLNLIILFYWFVTFFPGDGRHKLDWGSLHRWIKELLVFYGVTSFYVRKRTFEVPLDEQTIQIVGLIFWRLVGSRSSLSLISIGLTAHVKRPVELNLLYGPYLWMKYCWVSDPWNRSRLIHQRLNIILKKNLALNKPLH